MQSAIKCLVLMAGQHNVDLNVDSLLHDYNIVANEADNDVLIRIAKDHGFKAQAITHSLSAIGEKSGILPVIARLKDTRCVIVTSLGYDAEGKISEVTILDPTVSNPAPRVLSAPEFRAIWGGQLLLIKRKYKANDSDRPFDGNWVLSAYLSNKGLLLQLTLIAILLNIFAVLPAIFIMIVLDKVVNFQATSTLYVITAGVVIAYLFNGILAYLKQYIIFFISGKIDAKINIQLFSKLMDLPLRYFQTRNISETSKVVQHTVTLRQVISGKVFSALLDSTALLIFIPILYLYSPLLCIIVLGFALLMSANVLFSGRSQKKHLNTAAAADASKQTVLTDSVSGIDTVKSLALEPVQKKQWEEAVSHHTLAHLKVNSAGALSQQISNTLQQLMTVAVIFVGVQLVFSGDLSAGVLIAVNMLAGKVTGPLVQLVSLAMDVDKMKRATKSIGAVINHRGENHRTGVAPEILGGISFDGVSVSNTADSEILKNLSFNIKPRQGIAIIGSSGTEKAAIVQLMQGIIRPEEGAVKADNQDLRLIDLSYFRYSVACVNESVHLFKGTVRDNIVLPLPGATSARIAWATDLAGLTPDLEALPDGLETHVEEDGANLDNNLRYKIALSRALIRDPRILILDNLLAHFDLDNEQILRQQLPHIGMGRTLILVANRVSQVQGFEKILVMKQGELVEQGDHQTLLANNAHYTELWRKERALSAIQPPRPNAAQQTAEGATTV